MSPSVFSHLSNTISLTLGQLTLISAHLTLRPHWFNREWTKVPIKRRCHNISTNHNLSHGWTPLLTYYYAYCASFVCLILDATSSGCNFEAVPRNGLIVDFYEAGMRNEEKKINAWAMNCIYTEDMDNKNRYLNIQSTWYSYCHIFARFPCG